MLNQLEKDKITLIAGEFGVKRVWVFGSTLDENRLPGDIDLAVEGVPKGKFFKFFARLASALPARVDLVDLSDDPPIAQIIRDTGKVIYG